MAGGQGGSLKPAPVPSLVEPGFHGQHGSAMDQEKKMPAKDYNLKKKKSGREDYEYRISRRAPAKLKSEESEPRPSRNSNSQDKSRGSMGKSVGMIDQSSLTLTTSDSTIYLGSQHTFQVRLLGGSNHTDNQDKQYNRFRPDTSTGSMSSIDRPIQPPKPSYRQPQPNSHHSYSEHPTRRRESEPRDWRDQGRYYNEDYYEPHDRYEPRDRYQERRPPREYYDRPPSGNYGRSSDCYQDDRYYPYEDSYGRHYEPRYHPQDRHYDRYEREPSYDQGYGHPSSQEDPYRQRYEDDYHRSRYDRGYESRREPPRIPETSHRRRQEDDYDRYHSRRREEDYYYHQDEEEDCTRSSYLPRQYDKYDGGRSVSNQTTMTVEDSGSVGIDDSNATRFSVRAALKDDSKFRAAFKDDSNYEDPPAASASPLGAFAANGPGRTKEDKLLSSSAAGAADDVIYIEVFPGVSERLRRTQETKEAVESNFVTPVVCFACTSELYCIADVKYYICATCKCVSLLEDGGNCNRKFQGEPTGVGLGFSHETLYKMQSEMARRR